MFVQMRKCFVSLIIKCFIFFLLVVSKVDFPHGVDLGIAEYGINGTNWNWNSQKGIINFKRFPMVPPMYISLWFPLSSNFELSILKQNNHKNVFERKWTMDNKARVLQGVCTNQSILKYSIY